MERRRALAIAAATATTTVGAVAAIAVNFGLLGFSATDSTPLGKLDAGRVAEVVNPAAPATPGMEHPETGGYDAGRGDPGAPAVQEEENGAGHDAERDSEQEQGHEEGHGDTSEEDD